MRPGDLVRINSDPDDVYTGEVGIIVTLLDLESYFNPYEVLIKETHRFYSENDLIKLTECD
jgi:hypothetical protein